MSRDQWLDGLEPGDAVLIVYPGMYSPIKPTAGELRATVGTVDVEKIYLRANGYNGPALWVWRDNGVHYGDQAEWFIKPPNAGPDYPNPILALERDEAAW